MKSFRVGALVLVLVIGLTGCGLLPWPEQGSRTETATQTDKDTGAVDQPSFEVEKSWALELRDEFESEIPLGEILRTEDHDVTAPCDGDARQFDAIRYYFMNGDGFDRVAWMNSIISTYKTRQGWEVIRQVDVDDPTETTSAVTLWSPERRLAIVSESESKDGVPILVIDTLGLCGL